MRTSPKKLLPILVGLNLYACNPNQDDKSQTKDMSLYLDFHTVKLQNLELDVDLESYIADKQKQLEEIYGRDNMVSIDIKGISHDGASKVAKEIIFRQMRFLQESMHNRFTPDVQDSILITDHELTADKRLKAKYDITIEVGLDNIGALTEKKFYIVSNPQSSALRALYSAEPECFNPADAPETDSDFDHLFYYYSPEKCTYKSQDWQVVNPQLQVSHDKISAYPEYDKIWADNTLTVFQVYTPSDDWERNDAGVYAYKNFLSILSRNYGSGTVTEGNMAAAIIDPLNNTKVVFEHTLADGRKLRFTTVLWNDDWDFDECLDDEGETIACEVDRLSVFREEFKKSDYVSYNGHAAYGANVDELNDLIDSEDYHVYYINACWSYSHNKSTTPSVDFIGNIEPSYFYLMADQNFSIISSLIKRDSYNNMLLDLEAHFKTNKFKKDHNPQLAISGEQNNTYQP